MFRYLFLLVLFIPCLIFTACQSEPENHLIKGITYTDDYKQGYIHIAAFISEERTTESRVAVTEIDKPGEFTLEIPAQYKNVYLFGYNDAENDGPPYKPTDPGFIPDVNPVILQKDITHVDLYSERLDEKFQYDSEASINI